MRTVVFLSSQNDSLDNASTSQNNESKCGIQNFGSHHTHTQESIISPNTARKSAPSTITISIHHDTYSASKTKLTACSYHHRSTVNTCRSLPQWVLSSICSPTLYLTVRRLSAGIMLGGDWCRCITNSLLVADFANLLCVRLDCFLICIYRPHTISDIIFAPPSCSTDMKSRQL
jgi:hypothetical protein